MGSIIRRIPFFVDTITIMPHSATSERYLDRPVSIRQFCQGKPCALDRNEETGDYTVRLQNGEFIEGPEI